MRRASPFFALSAALLTAGAPAMAADADAPSQQRAAAGPDFRALLDAAGERVDCRVIDRTLPGPPEHPAYDVISVLCDCDGKRGRLVTVRLLHSGRAAVRTEGVVSLGTGDTPFRAF